MIKKGLGFVAIGIFTSLFYVSLLHSEQAGVSDSGTKVSQLTGTASLDYDFSAASLTVQDLTITVSGAADGDIVSIGIPTTLQAGNVVCTGFVSAANTVTVRCMDVSGSNVDPVATTVRADVWKH